MVMATPLLKSLRESCEGELWGFGKSRAMRLYRGLDLFDRFVPNDSKDVVNFLDTVNTLKRLEFERGIILPHSFRSALVFFLSGVRERVGYPRNKRGFMLNHHVRQTVRPEPTVEHYLRMVETIGCKRLYETPLLSVTEDEEQKFDENHLDIGGDYVAFIIGAQYGPSKRWPEAHFSILADMIADAFGMMVYLLPGLGEEAVAERILSGVRNRERVQSRTLDIQDLKACLSRATAVVSNDTGPRHIAVALSVPTAVILGPMDETYTRYTNGFTTTIGHDLPCRPCNQKKCDRDHECLKGIMPEELLEVLERIIGARRAAASRTLP